MDAVDFIKAEARMCKFHSCSDCPMDIENNGTEKGCDEIREFHPEKAVAIVEKWLAEHPEPHRKTYKDDFMEKFPNTKKDSKGDPASCRGHVYGMECPERSCEKCWNAPMPESEDK